jgi:hypothetical protein
MWQVREVVDGLTELANIMPLDELQLQTVRDRLQTALDTESPPDAD